MFFILEYDYWVFLNFQNFNWCLKGHESLGVGSLSLSFCWTGNVHHSDNIPQRSLKVFSKWICLCHCAYIRVFLCWSSDISPRFRFDWPLSLLFQYFFHVPRLIFKNKTRPNWAGKVREMILFSVLCTVYCGRGCVSLESERGKELG